MNGHDERSLSIPLITSKWSNRIYEVNYPCHVPVVSYYEEMSFHMGKQERKKNKRYLSINSTIEVPYSRETYFHEIKKFRSLPTDF